MKRLLLLLVSAMIVFSCAPAAIEVRSKGIALPDNTVVHYREAGQGPALILVHGLGSSADVWRDSLLLLARGYRVIALDLPGYGKSDKPRADYSVQYYARTLHEFIRALGVKKVALAGNSLGGWIAALTALEHPEEVSHLILVDSAGLRRDTMPAVSINPATKEQMRALLLALFADRSFVTEAIVNEQWEYRKEIRATVQATLDSWKTSPPLLDDLLKQLTVPTLIVWGRQDTLTPLDMAERFAKGIPGAKLVVIENAGHLPQVEQPGAFYRAVKGFVRSW